MKQKSARSHNLVSQLYFSIPTLNMKLTTLWVLTLFSVCILQTIYLFFIRARDDWYVSSVPQENWKDLPVAIKGVESKDLREVLGNLKSGTFSTTEEIDQKITQLSELTEEMKTQKDLISQVQEILNNEKKATEDFKLEMEDYLLRAKAVSGSVLKQEKEEYLKLISSIIGGVKQIDVSPEYKHHTGANSR